VARFSDESVRLALCSPQAPRRYPLPGNTKIEVGVKLLTDAEMDGVRLRAQDTAKRKKADLLIDGERFFERLIFREIIAAAFVDPDAEGVPFFADESEVARIDNHLVMQLYELYVAHAQSMDPYAYCPPEQIEELADTIKKSENAVGLVNLYDGPTRASLIVSLALRLREMSQTLKSDTG
jgi:hypothetical protein